ncbi:hypothetical protein FB451DRAFT_1193987 [Mycena latifolia]|nr:hypothetical protein FB451DRAFT_1193987 [Mycena latifolia]
MTLRLTSPVMSSPRLTSPGFKTPFWMASTNVLPYTSTAPMPSMALSTTWRCPSPLQATPTHSRRSLATFFPQQPTAQGVCLFTRGPRGAALVPSSQAVREEALPGILADPALPIGSLEPFVRGIAGNHRRSVPAIPPLICATRKRTSTIGMQPLAAPRVDLCSSIINIYCNPAAGLEPGYMHLT